MGRRCPGDATGARALSQSSLSPPSSSPSCFIPLFPPPPSLSSGISDRLEDISFFVCVCVGWKCGSSSGRRRRRRRIWNTFEIRRRKKIGGRAGRAERGKNKQLQWRQYADFPLLYILSLPLLLLSLLLLLDSCPPSCFSHEWISPGIWLIIICIYIFFFCASYSSSCGPRRRRRQRQWHWGRRRRRRLMYRASICSSIQDVHT